VSGGQRRRFIEEEQLGIRSGRHHRPTAPFKLEQTNDPSFGLPRSDNATV
jgi:hypothetical protein